MSDGEAYSGPLRISVPADELDRLRSLAISISEPRVVLEQDDDMAAVQRKAFASMRHDALAMQHILDRLRYGGG